MGQVYRARDTKLNRDVALKVLPDSFASDPDRLARFTREAQSLAALNHPNIAAIYGIEESTRIRALVMELVEGDDLSQRIARGAIPLDEALPIAKQIAEALEAAHEQGIVHRDLKPANVKVRSDGVVKVLDFGLAKAMEPVGALSASASMAPTITTPAMTQAGMILGTAAYMSPEQARGKTVDKRADIWAFGAVLFEMLAGRRPFDGEDMTEVLGAVVRLEPPWDALPSDVPAPVRTLLQSCLVKDPRRRVADIAIALFVLDKAASLEAPAVGHAGSHGQGPASVQTQVDAAVSTSRREAAKSMRRQVALVGAATLVIGGVIVGATTWWAMRPAPPRVLRTEVTTAGATALSMSGADRDLAITPDGSRIVYRGTNQLLVRALDQLEPDVLSGLGAPRGVFVSPDGQWVGFFDGNSALKRVAITGGPPVTIAPVDSAGARGATWGADGTIVYATNAPGTGLQRVSAAGGDPTMLTTPNRERSEIDHLWPEFLPGGQAVLFTMTATGGLDNAQIAVLDLATGTSKVVVRGGHHAHYAPTGHLVYGAGGTLRAVAFDLGRLEVVGTPVPVLNQVVTTGGGAVDVAVAANGTLVYVPGRGGVGTQRSLVWVDRMGREEPVVAPVRAYTYPRLSPDGTRVALDIRDEEQDIWIWDVARETLTRFTFDPANDQYPVWSPDSRRLLFASARAGVFNLFWQAADGTGAVERLTEGPNTQYAHTMTPDGSRVIFREDGPQQHDLLLLPLQPPRRPQLPSQGFGEPRPLVQTIFSERNAELSPDGRWLAYESNESGREEIYVRPFPDVRGGQWQVSTGGGRLALWSRNGQELFYVSPDGTLMAVRVETASPWRSSTPARILQGQYFFGIAGTGRTYDIAPDGKRFLMIKEGGGTEAAPQNLVVVQNWFEELKRLVPVN
jgi:serine/threonine-protein kinase